MTHEKGMLASRSRSGDVPTAAALWAPFLLLFSRGSPVADCFSAPRRPPRSAPGPRLRLRPATALPALPAGAASLLAGSVGGAIGVGVAYPLDTLKTKSQVYGQLRARERREDATATRRSPSTGPSDAPRAMGDGAGAAPLPLPPPGVVCAAEECYPVESAEDDLISLVKVVLENEGIAGFFGGVKAMMIGQALIKSVAFGANEMALGALRDSDLLGVAGAVGSSGAEEVGGGGTSFPALLIAAAFSGFVTSFLVAPVGECLSRPFLFVDLDYGFHARSNL